MAIVDIIYNGITTTIKWNENELIKDVLHKFCNKIGKNSNKMLFLYGGNTIEMNKTFNDLANSEDKQRQKIAILVFDNNSTVYQNSKKYKFIICPKCHEPTRFKIKDFKIKLYGCPNGHIIDNLTISDMDKSQLIDESKIICDICKNVNKGKTYNNSFFICNTCNKNICPLCNSTHNKKHCVIEYSQKFFICNLHNKSYSRYCKECKMNICKLCENEHIEHDIIAFKKILLDKNILEENKNLRIVIDKFKNVIEDIRNKLNDINNNLESYYNIYIDIMTSYNIQKNNYQILKNIYYTDKYNNEIIEELYNVINDDNIRSQLKNIMNIYNKINLDINESIISNEVKIKIQYENKIKEIQNEYNALKDKYEKLINNERIYKIKGNDKGNKYEGELIIDKKEGKIKYNYSNGDIYEGEFKNYKKEGKGIYYFNNFPWKGDRYEGDFKNDLNEGKGIYYYNKGDRYEGDFKNNKREGKGIFYHKNGDREMGDYLNDEPIGRHVILTYKGEIKTKYYN